MSNDIQPTRRLIEKIQAWHRARKRRDEAERSLAAAKNTEAAAQAYLGEALCPDNAKPGETFCVWAGDGLLRATKYDVGYDVDWKQTPSARSSMDLGL